MYNASNLQNSSSFAYYHSEQYYNGDSETVNKMTTQNKRTQILQHLELSIFKVTPCQIKTLHNQKQCIYFHSSKVFKNKTYSIKDKRRKGDYYSSEMCLYSEKGDNTHLCPLGDTCPKSHNKVESLYSKDKYKKKFCTFYPYNCYQCEYGDYCSFAHSEEDISTELIHNLEFDTDFYIFYYKTVWCPFNYLNHDRANCVYAHNWQDFRRKPSFINYEPLPCLYWKTNDFVIKYERGCQNSFSCKKCHGWKELEYHPMNFKVKECQLSQKCPRMGQCPFFHHKIDQRNLDQYNHSQYTILVPRNRIINSVFKQGEMIPKEKLEEKQKNNKLENVNTSDSFSQERLNKNNVPPHLNAENESETEENEMVQQVVANLLDESF